MAKKRIEYLPNVNMENRFLMQRNITVYPIHYNNRWYICINSNGKIKQFEKSINQSEINKAIHATIKYAYNRIVNNIPIETPF